ncbi:MAG: T9SS type A sorting domain-containing protein [Bacteroidota bacterium]
MKKIITSLFLIITLHLKAQQHSNKTVMHYWGDSAMWIIEEFVTASPPAINGIYYHMQYIQDTVVNNKIYHRLKDAYLGNNLYGMSCYMSLLQPLLRRDSLFFVINENGNIYFDFSPTQKNDSTAYIYHCLYYAPSPSKYKADSIWYENNGTYNLKFIRVMHSPYPFIKYGLWIEGIGSADGGFMPFGYHDGLVNNWYCGRCFSYNDTIYYLNLPPYSRPLENVWNTQGGGYQICGSIGTLVKIRGRCDTLSAFKGKILGIDVLKTENDFVKVYPQPLIDELYIELPFQNNTSIRLYDIKGSVIKEFQSIGEKMILPTNDMPSGFYFIEIKLNNELIIRKKVIKL